MMISKLKKQQGFTLLETIVSLIIAVLLIAMSISIYSQYAAHQKSKKAADELYAVGGAYKAYLSANQKELVDLCVAGGGSLQNTHVSTMQLVAGRSGCLLFDNTLTESLKPFMASGVLPPDKSPYGQPYEGRGVVFIDRENKANSTISPLLFAGDLIHILTPSTAELDRLTASHIVNDVNGYAGYTYYENGDVKEGGHGEFDLNQITFLAQPLLGTLPPGYLFYIGDGENIGNNWLDLSTTTADARYLLRLAIPNHPEYNTMKTNIFMGDNPIITHSGVIFNASTAQEGTACLAEQEHMLVRGEEGALLQCRKLNAVVEAYTHPSSTFTGSTGTPLSYFSLSTAVNAQMFAAGEFEWQYASPENVPDSGMYVSNGSMASPEIQFPQSYPYGDVQVCIFQGDISNTFLNDFSSLSQENKKTLLTALYRTDMVRIFKDQAEGYVTQPQCYSMQAGQILNLPKDTYGWFVRYKGHLTPTMAG